MDKNEAVYISGDKRTAIYRLSDDEFSMIISEQQYNGYKDAGVLETAFYLTKEMMRDAAKNSHPWD